MKRKFRHPETQATRGAADLEKKNGPMSLPIYQTSTFEVRDNEEQLRVTGSDSYYTRYGNPTHTALHINHVPPRLDELLGAADTRALPTPVADRPGIA